MRVIAPLALLLALVVTFDTMEFDQAVYEVEPSEQFEADVIYFGPHINKVWICFEYDEGLEVEFKSFEPGSGWHTDWNGDYLVTVTNLGLSPGGWYDFRRIVAVDTGTGEQQVIVELADLAEAGLDLRLGGTYNVAVDRSGKTIYIGMNAGHVDEPEEGFGEVVLLIVTLP